MESNTLITYNVSNAIDATNATTKGQEQEVKKQSRQIIDQSELEIGENDMGSLGVLKATSQNVVKR